MSTANVPNVTYHQSTTHGPQTSFMATLRGSTYSDLLEGFPAFIILCLTLSIILVLFTSVVLLFTRLHKLKNSVSLEHYEEEIPEMTASRKRCNKSYREKINSVYFTWTPDNWTSA
ncbi:hypothetical protein AOLI_G00238860 [Acnodon oligacanthus]